MTKNVDRSNRTTSSASHIEQKLLRWDSNVRILGIKACTMVDHAYGKVDSDVSDKCATAHRYSLGSGLRHKVFRPKWTSEKSVS